MNESISQAGQTGAAPVGAGAREWAALRLTARDWCLIFFVGDAAVLGAALTGAQLTSVGRSLRFEELPFWMQYAALLVIWLLTAPASGAYRVQRTATSLGWSQAGARTAALAVTAYVTLLTVLAVLPQWFAGAIVLLVLSVVGMAAWRYAAAGIRRLHTVRRPALIIGAGWAGQTILRLMREQLGHEYEAVGFLDDDPEKIGTCILGLPVLAPTSRLRELACRHGAYDVFLAVPHYAHTDMALAVAEAYEYGVRLIPMTELYEAMTGRVPIAQVGSYWYCDLPLRDYRAGLEAWLKRVTDVVMALLGLVVLAVIVPPVALAIRMDTPGPVFYRQVRVGRWGRHFELVKFRTMVADAEADGRAIWARPGDRRVTRVGRILRRSRLDELPQFWAVLLGHMSLVGPRPERPELVEQLERSIPCFRSRLLVAPGLTGWAQVNSSYASSEEDTLLKLQYDLYYVKHWSLFLDLVILLRTIGVVLRLEGT